MDSLTITMSNKNTSLYFDILIWLRDNAIAWTAFLLGWKAISEGVKIIKESRDRAERIEATKKEAFIRQIVQEEINKGVSLKLDNLSEKVEMLGDAIFKLNTKL